MRLSFILLVAAAFVACLNFTAANGASVVNAATSTNVMGSNRFLRVHHEDKYLAKDELEEDSDDENESDKAEERGWLFGETSTALSAFKKLVSQSGDDLVEAVSNLSKSEVDALFKVGQSHMAKMVPGFHPGMDLHDFGTVVRSARNAGKLNGDMENALMVGYGKYLAHQMD